MHALRETTEAAPTLSPQRYSEILGLSLQEIAEQARVHRNTITRAPGSRTVQAHLREAVRVIKAATDLYGDLGKALFWYRNEPLSDFDYRTAEELVAAGRASSLVAYVESLSEGFAG